MANLLKMPSYKTTKFKQQPENNLKFIYFSSLSNDLKSQLDMCILPKNLLNISPNDAVFATVWNHQLN